MNRPDQERIEGSRPSVPADFYWGMLETDSLDPTPLKLPTEEQDQPTPTFNQGVYRSPDGSGYMLSGDGQKAPFSFQHTTTANPTPAPTCRLCGDLLTIVDTGDVCRQCRLEGRNE